MKKNIIKISAGAISATVLLGLAGNFPVKSATEHWNDASEESTNWKNFKANWQKLSKNYENVSLTPGEDETKLNYAWYSKTQEIPKVKIGTKSDLSDAKEFSGTQRKNVEEDVKDYFSNKVTVCGLKENTTYYYQVFQNGKWNSVKTYKTKSFSDFSFFYVGDPQIGASKKQVSSEGDTMSSKDNGSADDNLAARNDAYNWNEVLKNAVANYPNASFMISAGDQINSSGNESEYAGYLSAEALSSLPVATTIGNHDSTSARYSEHFNNPNNFENTSDEAYTKGKTAAGTDYYYRYGDVLFIVLDTNNYNCATHENVIKKAVASHPNARWRIATFHQDIYGSGKDHSDSDGIILRTQLTPLLDKYDIDVALQGHDHTYSRSYQLTGDGKQHTAYDKSSYGKVEDKDTYLNQNNCYSIKSNVKNGTVVNPQGTVYFEANSGTGSKFYELIPTQQDYIAERSQTWKPSYSVVNVTETSLTVTTYDAKTGGVMDGSSSYTIIKEADKTKLKSMIKAAKQMLENGSYKEESIQSTKHAIEEAQKTVDDSKATSKEISEKETRITKSLSEIKLKENQKNNVSAAETKNATETNKTITENVKAGTNIKSVFTNKKVTGIKVNSLKNGFKVTYKKVSKASGYEISYSTNKSQKKNIKVVSVKKTVTAKSIRKLKKGSTYYIKVRAYQNTSGKKVYGAYSKVVKVTIK